MAAADSPASASSSTLIVPSEPNLSSDKLAQFESTNIATGRPRPLGIKMPVPHTRLSGKGFIEPHKSNLPRRTTRGRTRTRERDVVPSASEEGASPIPIPAAVRSPPPPPLNLGSPTELGFPNAKDEDDELPLETAQTTRTEPPTSSMAHLSFAAATAAILSSTAADTSDRPLPHPAMGLTMGLMNAAAAAAAKRTGSPARGNVGLDVVPGANHLLSTPGLTHSLGGLLGYTSPALGVRGSPTPTPSVPVPIPIPTSYPSEVYGTPPLSTSNPYATPNTPRTPPASSGPQVGNLPRRHRRGRAELGLGSPVPHERRPAAGALRSDTKESLDSELSSKEKQVNVDTAADTLDRPLHHPAMGLTMGLMNAAAAAAAKRTNSPARGGLDVTPGLLSFTSPALGVRGSPTPPVPIPSIPTAYPTAYPSTPPLPTSSNPNPYVGTPPLSSSIPQTPPTSSGPQVGNLPRRHRRGRAGLGLGSPVPQERRPGAGAKESLDSELASKEKQDMSVDVEAKKEREQVGLGAGLEIQGAEGEGDLLEPGKILKFVRLPLLQPHRQGRRTSSEEKDARERRREMSLPRTGVSAVSESPIHSRSRSRGQWRERDMSRSPLPIRNVGAGYDEAGGASSLPQRERSARVRESASRTREVRMDDLVRHHEPEREGRLKVSSSSEKEEKKRKRDERRDKRCLQVIGRSAVEVGFLDEDEDDVGYELEADAQDQHAEEDEDDETKKKKEDERKACRAGLAGGYVLVSALSRTGKSSRARGSDDELKLRLPTDPTRFLEGVPSLTKAQMREGCEFIRRHLCVPALSNRSDLEEEHTEANGDRRIRILTPRWRPEEALALAVCYLAWEESVGDLSSTSGISTSTSTHSPATRLVPSTSTSTLSSSASFHTADEDPEEEDENATVRGMGAARLRPRPSKSNPLQRKWIVPPGVNDLPDGGGWVGRSGWGGNGEEVVEVDIDINGLETKVEEARKEEEQLEVQTQTDLAERDADVLQAETAPMRDDHTRLDAEVEIEPQVQPDQPEPEPRASDDPGPAAPQNQTVVVASSSQSEAHAPAPLESAPTPTPAPSASEPPPGHIDTDADTDTDVQQPASHEEAQEREPGSDTNSILYNPQSEAYTYTPFHLLAMRLLDDDDGGVWLGNVADAKGKAKEAVHPLLEVGPAVAAKVEVSAFLATVVQEDVGVGADGGSNEDVDGSESGYGSVGWAEKGKAERRGRSRNRRRHVREAAFAGRSFSVEVVRHGVGGYELQEAAVDREQENVSVVGRKEVGEDVGEEEDEEEEDEEPLEWTGLRMEWRGVLSFEGLQALVGVWDD